jgi:hypothetical protein
MLILCLASLLHIAYTAPAPMDTIRESSLVSTDYNSLDSIQITRKRVGSSPKSIKNLDIENLPTSKTSSIRKEKVNPLTSSPISYTDLSHFESEKFVRKPITYKSVEGNQIDIHECKIFWSNLTSIEQLDFTHEVIFILSKR